MAQLNAILEAIKAGDRAGARQQVLGLLEQDSENEGAWLALAACAANQREFEQSLRQVLALNPYQAQARRLLEHNGLALPELPQAGAPSKAKRGKKAKAAPKAKAGRSSRSRLLLLLILLLVLGGLGAFLLLGRGGEEAGEASTEVLAEASPIPTESPSAEVTEAPSAEVTAVPTEVAALPTPSPIPADLPIYDDPLEYYKVWGISNAPDARRIFEPQSPVDLIIEVSDHGEALNLLVIASPQTAGPTTAPVQREISLPPGPEERVTVRLDPPDGAWALGTWDLVLNINGLPVRDKLNFAARPPDPTPTPSPAATDTPPPTPSPTVSNTPAPTRELNIAPNVADYFLGMSFRSGDVGEGSAIYAQNLPLFIRIELAEHGETLNLLLTLRPGEARGQDLIFRQEVPPQAAHSVVIPVKASSDTWALGEWQAILEINGQRIGETTTRIESGQVTAILTPSSLQNSPGTPEAEATEVAASTPAAEATATVSPDSSDSSDSDNSDETIRFFPDTPVNVRLVYTPEALYLKNLGETPLDISRLVFVQEAGGELFRFDAQEWQANFGDFRGPGSTYGLQAESCFQVGVDANAASIRARECLRLVAWKPRNLDGQFWVLNNAQVRQFEVFWGEEQVATCQVDLGVCEFGLPDF